MPHIHIDYSANLERLLDPGALCEALRREAATIEAFPMPGIRVRAIRVDHYAIADGDPAHGFVDIRIRIREGRPAEVKEAALAHLFEAARQVLCGAMAEHSIALSAELRDIDAQLSRKCGTIRDHLGGGA
ncbi:5-carboxymethyl-2-hydroxymuconate isomerase [Roseobacter sp. EG26]|uniref:5-carboxymethyl-2-hydroxymuconate Delta-isomerase n=1 Tax=Roseobacter sp. EG26 TaxID=3412477 RepID=UPI003CE4C8A2